MSYKQLKLENQLCFPLYATSRLMTRAYQPYLSKMGITYPQYLVLLVLWEKDSISINDISKKLILNTNTLTPLLKRLETQGLISRFRSEKDERVVIIKLTKYGKELQEKAAIIPQKLLLEFTENSLTIDDIEILKQKLNDIIQILLKQDK